MKRRTLAAAVLAAALLAAAAALAQTAVTPAAAPAGPPAVALPKPDVTGKVTLEQAIARRRSVREYAPGALTLAEVSQVLWAGQGITGEDGRKRAVPSARAVYPIQVWLVAMDVNGLAPGIYRYQPEGHALVPVRSGGPREAIVAATPGQAMFERAPAAVAIVGDSVLAAAKFGGNAARWLGMEAGFAVQEVYLQATALGLGTVMVGGFQPAPVHSALGLPEGWLPLGLMPLGRRK